MAAVITKTRKEDTKFFHVKIEFVLGILNVEITSTGKKRSEFQMGFEPTTLRDVAGRSNH